MGAREATRAEVVDEGERIAMLEEELRRTREESGVLGRRGPVGGGLGLGSGLRPRRGGGRGRGALVLRREELVGVGEPLATGKEVVGRKVDLGKRGAEEARKGTTQGCKEKSDDRVYLNSDVKKARTQITFDEGLKEIKKVKLDKEHKNHVETNEENEVKEAEHSNNSEKEVSVDEDLYGIDEEELNELKNLETKFQEKEEEEVAEKEERVSDPPPADSSDSDTSHTSGSSSEETDARKGRRSKRKRKAKEPLR